MEIVKINLTDLKENAQGMYMWLGIVAVIFILLFALLPRVTGG